jgi:signal transduction histidine kinase
LFLALPVALALGVTRYDLIDYPPGVNTVGERAVFGDTAAPVFVLDTDGNVVRTNHAAQATFDDPETLADVADCTVTDLVRRDTVGCWTDNGRRQFDPRVTTLRTDGGATLGHAVTFVDVTAREIRRQRISVLNRVLRHNLRNQLDVIRAHAEEAGAEPAVEGVDRLDRLASEIRNVERLLDREGSGTRRTVLSSFLEQTVAAVTEGIVVDTTVVAPDETVTVDLDLCEYVLRNLVENAVEHGGDTPRVAVRGRLTPEGVRIVVADDGPGIPEAERAVIEAGEETPLSHATSVGLWGTRWAVGAMNGSLSFADSDLGGTAVTVVVPESQETVEGVEAVDDPAAADADDGDQTADDGDQTDEDTDPDRSRREGEETTEATTGD